MDGRWNLLVLVQMLSLWNRQVPQRPPPLSSLQHSCGPPQGQEDPQAEVQKWLTYR